eukprot:TRINITY_DN12705_c0_g1_i1.p1 TRINITY_DN12705_c0_g1~~TRINITY_DN12705_c0_g1_i1.p1  ORF type:complete len:202 (+),score=48.22 TRINITY_DN12705_c0_g1_i1:83-688(+)
MVAAAILWFLGAAAAAGTGALLLLPAKLVLINRLRRLRFVQQFERAFQIEFAGSSALTQLQDNAQELALRRGGHLRFSICGQLPGPTLFLDLASLPLQAAEEAFRLQYRFGETGLVVVVITDTSGLSLAPMSDMIELANHLDIQVFGLAVESAESNPDEVVVQSHGRCRGVWMLETLNAGDTTPSFEERARFYAFLADLSD